MDVWLLGGLSGRSPYQVYCSLLSFIFVWSGKSGDEKSVDGKSVQCTRIDSVGLSFFYLFCFSFFILLTYFADDGAECILAMERLFQYFSTLGFPRAIFNQSYSSSNFFVLTTSGNVRLNRREEDRLSTPWRRERDIEIH